MIDRLALKRRLHFTGDRRIIVHHGKKGGIYRWVKIEAGGWARRAEKRRVREAEKDGRERRRRIWRGFS